MLHVGLTGNIASGKSHVAHVFAELGAHIICADLISHELLRPGTATYAKVVEAFGRAILNSDGTVNRRQLGAEVFGDEGKRLLLNSLVHTDVRNEILQRIFDLERQNSRGIVIVDAALMIESGSYKFYDRLIVVSCDPALQLGRIIHRDGLDVEQANARIVAQMPTEEKLRLADYHIETSGTFKETRQQVEAVYRDLLIHEAKRFRA